MSQWDWIGLAALVAVVIVTAVVVIALVIRMIKKYQLVIQPGMPVSAKITFFASIAYAIFPLDLLPDPVLIDDIAVMVGALAYIGHCAKKLANKPLPEAEIPYELTNKR
jgi:uncharacterized membrane protein YkvA (DUF1232 family)